MISLYLLFIAVTASQAFQWTQNSTSPANGTTIPVCIEQDVTLAWSYTLSADEQLAKVEWHYTPNGGSKERLLATALLGNFRVTPGSTQHLQFQPNAGIRIGNVNTSDAGTYSVHVILIARGSEVTHVHTVKVFVSDGNLTTDGELHLWMLPEAEYDNSTQLIYVQLACGDFIPGWGAGLSVVWSTPTSDSVPSTSYDNGRFLLSLPNDVASGEYTCAINNTSPASSCMHSDSPLRRGGAITVDDVQLQLILIEKRTKAQELDRDKQIAEQEAIVAHLKSKLDVVAKSVSFHAEIETRTYSAASPIDHFDTVYHNEGGAFNATSGAFNVPVNGTYIFLFSLFGYTTGNSNAYMMVDNTILNECYGHRTRGYIYTQGICQIVMRLRAGQHVWVQNGYGSFEYGDSYFSGALLHADMP